LKPLIISRRSDLQYETFLDLREVPRADYYVIANETYLHESTLAILNELGVREPILVEKPLNCLRTFPALPDITVGFHLRFSDAVKRTKEILTESGAIQLISAYVGQHLTQWRASQPVHSQYSAHKNRGGGVLRDLSHEIDLLTYLVGPWDSVVAQSLNTSTVTVDSEDSIMSLIKFQSGALGCLTLNYLDHDLTRTLRIVAEKKSLTLDLAGNFIRYNSVLERYSDTRVDMTYCMHRAVLNGGSPMLCNFSEGLVTDKIIVAMERSEKEASWIPLMR
jgi:predicted dehydrogenase